MTTTEDRSFPNKVVRVDIPRSSFNAQLQNLVPRIGWLANTSVLPKGNTIYDLGSNTLYFSNGIKWIPIANAESFMTTTDLLCPPDKIVAIGPSTFVTGADVGIAMVPRGDGGVSLSAPDLLPSGGNCRGPYAVDLQIQRLTATQIASGANSGIGSGINNEASGQASHVAGGTGNISSGINSCVPGGSGNVAFGNNSLAAGQNAAALTTNSICLSCDTTSHSTTVNNEFKIGLQSINGRMTIDNLIAFNDDAAAGGAGLTIGMHFQTTGAGAAPLNAPGIVMIKK